MKKSDIMGVLKSFDVKGRREIANVIDDAMRSEGRKKDNFFAACKGYDFPKRKVWEAITRL